MLLFLSIFRLGCEVVIFLSGSVVVRKWPFLMVLCERVYVHQENIKVWPVVPGQLPVSRTTFSFLRVITMFLLKNGHFDSLRWCLLPQKYILNYYFHHAPQVSETVLF